MPIPTRASTSALGGYVTGHGNKFAAACTRVSLTRSQGRLAAQARVLVCDLEALDRMMVWWGRLRPATASSSRSAARSRDR